MFEGMRILDSTYNNYANKRVVVGLALPDWASFANVTARGVVNLRESKGVYVINIASLNAERVAESLQLVPSSKFFGDTQPPILFGEVINMMGKTELSVPYSLSKLPYTFSDYKDFEVGSSRESANNLLFVLAVYEVETGKGQKPTKLVSVLSYGNGSVLILPEEDLIREVKNSVLRLVNAKIVTRGGLPHLVGINHSLPVLEVVKEGSSAVKENIDSKKDDLKLKKLNHDKYRHRVLSKYIRQYLHGNLTPYKFLNKSRMAKTTDKEIKILFDEVFKPLYPQQVELFQRDYKHVNMGLVLEYFIVTFLADKKGYKSKYPIETPVNTADSNFYLKEITSQKWGFVSKLRNKELLHQYLGHVNDMRRFAMVFSDTDYGKETQRFLELKNSLYAVKANTKYRFREEDIFGVESKPLVRMLLALTPKNYKLEVENYTYKVEDLYFSEVHEGFRVMGYTLDESDVREKVETPHKVYFATKNSKVVRYIYDGSRENGKLAGVTFNGEPLYAPDIKSFGAYYIVKSLSEYYAKHKEITDLGKLKLLHLLAIRERGLFEQVAKQIGFEVSSGTLDALEIALVNIVDKCHFSVKQSLFSGGFFAPYVVYTVNEGFDMPRYRYHQKFGNIVEEYSLEEMAQVIKNHLGAKIITDGTLLTHDL